MEDLTQRLYLLLFVAVQEEESVSKVVISW